MSENQLINLFSTSFLILLTLKLFVQIYLVKRNIGHIQSHQNKVPPEFSEKISHQDHLKAAQYTIAKARFSIFSLVLAFLLTLIWLPAGALDMLDQWCKTLHAEEVYQGLIFFMVFSLIGVAIDLPEKIYETFVIEEKFGFNKTTPKLFITDMLKQLALAAIIGLPFLWALLKIMQNLGALWWLYGWIFLTLFQLFIIWAYPNFIAPLFNKFSKLENQEMVAKIEKLLERVDFAHSGLFVMDASRRSSHGNAYFTGLGKTKRIVFFDNLLKSLTPNEVEAVLAHELGHFKKKHIIKMLISSLVFSFIGFFVLGKVYQLPEFFNGHFIQIPSTYMALVLFSMVAPAYTFFITPIQSWLSRKHEYEADEFAAKNSNAQELINALVKLYKENASTLTPDPIYSKFYHSHPPAMERIEFLKSKMN